MSDRHGTHNGRDLDGHFRVREEDVDELLESPDGAAFVRDDIRLGGAIADTGPHAGQHGHDVSRMIAENREDVGKATKGS